MKSFIQYILHPVAVIFALSILVSYIVWIQLFPPRKVRLGGIQKKHVYFDKLPDWNLN